MYRYPCIAVGVLICCTKSNKCLFTEIYPFPNFPAPWPHTGRLPHSLLSIVNCDCFPLCDTAVPFSVVHLVILIV